MFFLLMLIPKYQTSNNSNKFELEYIIYLRENKFSYIRYIILCMCN